MWFDSELTGQHHAGPTQLMAHSLQIQQCLRSPSQVQKSESSLNGNWYLGSPLTEEMGEWKWSWSLLYNHKPHLSLTITQWGRLSDLFKVTQLVNLSGRQAHNSHYWSFNCAPNTKGVRQRKLNHEISLERGWNVFLQSFFNLSHSNFMKCWCPSTHRRLGVSRWHWQWHVYRGCCVQSRQYMLSKCSLGK